MHGVYHRLPGERREPTLSRTKAGRAGRRASAPEGRQAVRRGAEILHQLQTLRSRLPVGCENRRYYPARPGALQHAKAVAAGRDSEPYRSDGQRLDAVCPAGECRDLPQTGASAAGCHAEDRPSPQPAEIFSRHLPPLVQIRRGGAGAVRRPGGLFPRLLCELQPPAAGQRSAEGDERHGNGRSATEQREVLRRTADRQRVYR